MQEIKEKSNIELEIMIGRNLDTMKEMLVRFKSEIMEYINNSNVDDRM